MQKMSTITWEGHNLSTDPHLPRAYEASILNPPLQITGYATVTLQCNILK